MASVVISDGTPKMVVTTPLTSPISEHSSTATTMARTVGRPESMKKCMTNGDRVQTNPTDRSISPQTITSTRPMPMITYGAMYWAMLTKLPWLTNCGVVSAK